MPLGIFAFALIYGTVGYLLIEGWDVFDAVYMTVITLTTVGFGEVHQLSAGGRLFTISLILFGIVTVAASVASLADVLVSGELGESVRRRRRTRMINQLNDHYIICAFGRVGRTAAQEFKEQGVPFLAIDVREDLTAMMEEQGINYLIGDPTEESVLRQAGIDRAKGLVCAVDSDATNVYITLTARAINPGLSIVARASNPESVDKLMRAGA
ncbi:MAG: potassium channel family protein, partial [Acidimicrobiia bacterium]